MKLTCNEEFFPADREHPSERCTNICPVDQAIYPHARLAVQAKLNPLVRFAMCNLHAIANINIFLGIFFLSKRLLLNW